MVNKEDRGGIYSAKLPKDLKSFLVFDSPHSGRNYPRDFNYICDFDVLRRSEDALVDQLFEPILAEKYPFLKALFPRSYIDVNRDSRKIDGKLVRGSSEKLKIQKVREIQGTGLIRRFCSYTVRQPIYDRKLSLSEVFNRVSGYYSPYHERLSHMLDRTYREMGKYVYISCHSLPSKFRDGKDNPYDIYLGTQDGRSCDPVLLEHLQKLFEDKGYKVADNKFFKGGHNIKKYSAPENGKHAILIEVNRKLYLNENTLLPNKNFKKLQGDLLDIITRFDTFTYARLGPQNGLSHHPDYRKHHKP